jgi:hypothetical protein
MVSQELAWYMYQPDEVSESRVIWRVLVVLGVLNLIAIVGFVGYVVQNFNKLNLGGTSLLLLIFFIGGIIFFITDIIFRALRG